jgi:uncharacterized membrane protein YphA (DoxX/SURF4 family)
VRWSPYQLSVLRIVTGLLFMQHGGGKLWGFAGGGERRNLESRFCAPEVARPYRVSA